MKRKHHLVRKELVKAFSDAPEVRLTADRLDGCRRLHAPLRSCCGTAWREASGCGVLNVKFKLGLQ